MRNLWGRISLRFSAFIAFILILPAVSSAAKMKTALYARAYQPGELILVRVDNHKDGRSPAGTFLGKELFFWRASTGTYQAFAGIDLDVATGTYNLEIELYDMKGKRRLWNKKIAIQPKEYPREMLEVDDVYVHLKKKDEERAQRETKRLHEIFAVSSPEIFMEKNFSQPIEGELYRFGARRVFNNIPKAPHAGADIKAKTGTPVLASGAGKVVLADHYFYPGKIVILDHGAGLFSLYMHLSKISVKEGQKVAQGERVGLVGATGRVTGPHLHWGIKFHEARIDPGSLLALPFSSP